MIQSYTHYFSTEFISVSGILTLLLSLSDHITPLLSIILLYTSMSPFDSWS
uniref:Uncharacterized protein n=1 Tax=Arion vulgaris TaxID=1028688 RepID=A0A0B6ZE04_9EUPU